MCRTAWYCDSCWPLLFSSGQPCWPDARIYRGSARHRITSYHVQSDAATWRHLSVPQWIRNMLSGEFMSENTWVDACKYKANDAIYVCRYSFGLEFRRLLCNRKFILLYWIYKDSQSFNDVVLGNPLSQTWIHLPVVPSGDDRSSPELHIAVCDSVEFRHHAAFVTTRQVIVPLLIPPMKINLWRIWVNACLRSNTMFMRNSLYKTLYRSMHFFIFGVSLWSFTENLPKITEHFTTTSPMVVLIIMYYTQYVKEKCVS